MFGPQRPTMALSASLLPSAVVAALIAAPLAGRAAELVPYQAEYSITAGAGDRAPQIGSARQRLSDGCQRRSFERDVNVALALTQTLRYEVNSVLHASESRTGRALDYKLDRVMNGEKSQRGGAVAVGPNGGKANLSAPNGPESLDLPGGTLLPQRMIDAILDHLQRGETNFTVEAFDAEVVTNLVEVNVQRVGAEQIAPRPQDAALIDRIGAPAYPLLVSFSRASGKPLFTAHILLHRNGVISRLVASFGPFTVAANLTAFQALPQLRCAAPGRTDG